MPFHFGSVEDPERTGVVNECTAPGWDPVSMQPHLKGAAAQLIKLNEGSQELQVKDIARDLRRSFTKGAFDRMAVAKSLATPAHSGQHVPVYLRKLVQSEQELSRAYSSVSKQHNGSVEIAEQCYLFALQSGAAQGLLQSFAEKYHVRIEPEASEQACRLFSGPRQADLGALEDLHDLYTLVAHVSTGHFVLLQAASAMEDEALSRAMRLRTEELETEREWLHRQIRAIAAQALVVPSLP